MEVLLAVWQHTPMIQALVTVQTIDMHVKLFIVPCMEMLSFNLCVEVEVECG